MNPTYKHKEMVCKICHTAFCSGCDKECPNHPMTHKIEWREKFDKIGWMGNDKVRKDVFDFIESEVIEALINDAKRYYGITQTPTGQAQADKELRAKWLSK